MRILNRHISYEDPKPALSPDEVRAVCCTEVPVDPCSEVGKVTRYDQADQGELPDPEERLRQVRRHYPDKRIVAVHVSLGGGPIGKPCGKRHQSWTGRNNCCDGVPALAIDAAMTPDILPHDGEILVYATGGITPLTFRTSSNGTWFADGRKSWTTDSPVVLLQAGPTFCGNTVVSVEDGCSRASMSIRSDLGRWQFVGYGCELAGVAGELLDQVISGVYRVEAVLGGTKVVDFQQVKTSYEMGTYYGALRNDTTGEGAIHGCPGPNQASCSGEWDGYNHCDCADAAGLPYFPRETCLAPNFGNYQIDPGNFCDGSSWLITGGLVAFYCSGSGAMASKYKAWMGGYGIPEVYKWVC